MATSKIYGYRAYKLTDKAIASCHYAYEEGDRCGWTIERIRESVKYRLPPEYDRLSDASKAAYWHASTLRFHVWQSKQIWTHVIDGHRCVSGHPIFEGRYCELNDSDESFHCYAFHLDGAIAWLPINENDRQRELDSGRLTQGTIDQVARGKAQPVVFVNRLPFMLQPVKESVCSV